MRKVNKIASVLLLSLCSGSFFSGLVAAAEQCPMEKRQSKAVGESVGKKVQKSFEAYTEGNVDSAIAILLEINARGGFDKAYVDRMLGNFYAEKGQMKTAIKYLKTAVQADILGGVDHAGTMKLYADLLLQEKQFKDAITYYYKWMAFACKEEAQTYRRIGIAYSELKDWNKVLQVADKGLSLSSEPDKSLYQMKLTAYFNQKKYKDAVNVLEVMVPLFQDDKRLWVQLAQFYLMTESYDKALATYDLAYMNGFLETDSNITRLAQLLAQKGSPHKAAVIFEKHMKSGLIKETDKTLTSLAGFYQNAKEFKEAAHYYGKAAALKNDGELYLKQGRLLALNQNYSAAIAVLKKSLDAGIKHPGEAQFELALAYLSLKKYKAAYQRAVLASNDSKTARSAKSYVAYIKEKARIYNVAL
jgi:tetratricopeptide (TPR) repeat protein